MSTPAPRRATLGPWSMSIAVLLLVFPPLTVQAGQSSTTGADVSSTRLYVAGEHSRQPMAALNPAMQADAEAVSRSISVTRLAAGGCCRTTAHPSSLPSSGRIS